MKKWTQKEIYFLKENYAKTLNKELVKTLNRNIGSIDYMAIKLELKKDYDFLCHSKKKLKKEFTKDMFIDLYYKKNKSIREIAKELGIGKNTVAHYFKKYNINLRNHSESNKVRALKYPSWRQGLNKETDPRILASAEKAKLTFDKKRKENLRRIEEKYGKSIKEIINNLYWNENLNQETIAKRIGLSREKIIKFMKEFNIFKRPNYEHIASIKGINRPQYGKTWEDLYGIKEAKRRKDTMSLISRRNIIRRLRNNEMPFLNTKIEIKVGKELTKRRIPYISQYPVDRKFVCDFVIPGFNIVIECDGDYWHANPKIYDRNNLGIRQKRNIQRDKFKDLYLSEKGWKVFRFFELDINKSPKKCIDKISNEIKNQLKSIKNPLDDL